jgi:hypothetical protein
MSFAIGNVVAQVSLHTAADSVVPDGPPIKPGTDDALQQRGIIVIGGHENPQPPPIRSGTAMPYPPPIRLGADASSPQPPPIKAGADALERQGIIVIGGHPVEVHAIANLARG